MTFRIDSVKACRHVNLVNFSPCYNIESQILAAEDKIEAAALQKLRRRLRNQVNMRQSMTYKYLSKLLDKLESGYTIFSVQA